MRSHQKILNVQIPNLPSALTINEINNVLDFYNDIDNIEFLRLSLTYQSADLVEECRSINSNRNYTEYGLSIHRDTRDIRNSFNKDASILGMNSKKLH